MDATARGQGDSAVRIRAAEVAVALCLATDLGMGFPWGHGLSATLAAMRLCDLLGVDSATRRDVYYLSLLTYVGCTADAAEKLGIYGGPITENIVGVIWGGRFERLRVVAENLPAPGASPARAATQIVFGMPRALAHFPREQLALCEIAQMTSRRLDLPESVADAFHFLTERWDGAGTLKRARGSQIPLALRIALLARDGTYLAAVAGTGYAARVIAERAGKAHDPQVAAVLAEHMDEVIGPQPDADQDSSPWDRVLRSEVGPPIVLEGRKVDNALAAVGDFADLLTPSRAGHASGVAALAGRAAELLGLQPRAARHVRHAALVEDVGRVSVPAAVWEKTGPLTTDEWEQVRLHPYYSQRVCAASPFLRELALDAACHHERLDGTGYHRGIGAEGLSLEARILAAADALRSLLEPGSGRPPVPLADAVAALAREGGRLDSDAVHAVVEAAGGEPPTLPRPAGLTLRESQVVGLVARGFATKQVARRLAISAKTADHHLQSAYRKIGVSSRAAVTLFAMEHGLVAWGELPIGGRSTPP